MASCRRPPCRQAVDNFLALCRGVDIGGTRRSYAGVPFTRLMSRFVVQAGDVVARDGSSECRLTGLLLHCLLAADLLCVMWCACAGGAHIHASCGEHFPDEGLDDRNYR